MVARPTTLTLIPGDLEETPSHLDEKVVAEILADGTIRTRSRVIAPARPEGGAWTTTSIAGAGWTIWLERRSWKDSPKGGGGP